MTMPLPFGSTHLSTSSDGSSPAGFTVVAMIGTLIALVLGVLFVLHPTPSAGFEPTVAWEQRLGKLGADPVSVADERRLGQAIRDVDACARPQVHQARSLHDLDTIERQCAVRVWWKAGLAQPLGAADTLAWMQHQGFRFPLPGVTSLRPMR